MVKTFTVQGLIVALVVELPLGALGGWVVDKRYQRLRTAAAAGGSNRTTQIAAASIGGAILVALIAFMIFGKASAPTIKAPAPPNWQNTYKAGNSEDIALSDKMKEGNGLKLDETYLLKHAEDNKNEDMTSRFYVYHYKETQNETIQFNASADASDSESEMNDLLKKNEHLLSLTILVGDNNSTKPEVVAFDSGVYALHASGLGSGKCEDRYFLFKGGYVYCVYVYSLSSEAGGIRDFIKQNVSF